MEGETGVLLSGVRQVNVSGTIMSGYHPSRLYGELRGHFSEVLISTPYDNRKVFHGGSTRHR